MLCACVCFLFFIFVIFFFILHSFFFFIAFLSLCVCACPCLCCHYLCFSIWCVIFTGCCAFLVVGLFFWRGGFLFCAFLSSSLFLSGSFSAPVLFLCFCAAVLFVSFSFHESLKICWCWEPPAACIVVEISLNSADRVQAHLDISKTCEPGNEAGTGWY